MEAVVESVTAHAEKAAGTKTTPYVGHAEEDDVEEQAEEVEELGGGRGKDKPHHPLMIRVQKVRIRLGKGDCDRACSCKQVATRRVGSRRVWYFILWGNADGGA